MDKKEFRDTYLLRPWATVAVLGEDIVPKETDIKALKEIIEFAKRFVAKWDRVWTLAEKRLEGLEGAQRILQSRDN